MRSSLSGIPGMVGSLLVLHDDVEAGAEEQQRDDDRRRDDSEPKPERDRPVSGGVVHDGAGLGDECASTYDPEEEGQLDRERDIERESETGEVQEHEPDDQAEDRLDAPSLREARRRAR